MGQAVTGAIVVVRFVGRMWPGAVMIVRMIAMMRVHRDLRRNVVMPGQMHAPGRARNNQRAQKENKGNGAIHANSLSEGLVQEQGKQNLVAVSTLPGEGKWSATFATNFVASGLVRLWQQLMHAAAASLPGSCHSRPAPNRASRMT